MPNTSYHRVASSVVEMLEELSAQVLKRHVHLTTQTVSPSKKDKGKRSREKWHEHNRRGRGTV
jgi:hypothetical protein